MANEYTPTVWRTGDIITAEKLNKIEEGIANAGENLIPLKTATVTAHYDETGATPTNIESAQIVIYIDDKNIAEINYDDLAAFPVSMLGDINTIKIPVYNDPNGKSIPSLNFYDNDNSYSITEFTINSGDASNVDGNLVIAGDCDVTLKLESYS